jgi:diguanylate cyclase (GGDEF)-like protein
MRRSGRLAEGPSCYICMRIEDLEGSGIPQPRLRRRSGTRVPASRRSPSSTRLDLASRLRPLQSALRSRLSRADALAEVTRAVNATLDPERVADAIVACAADWLPVPAWVVYAYDNTGIRTLGSRGVTSTVEATAVAVGEWVLKQGAPCTVGDVAADDRFEALAPVAALGFPLECRGRVVGALVGVDRAASPREPALTAATQAALRLALEPGGIALDNAIRVQRAEALSVTDDLTQLYNSRFLNDALRKETKRAMRSGWPLSLLFIDLDGFKKINDAHGHLLGSRALIEAAAVIRGSARETDIVARFGGDEFAILLPETGVEGAQSVARRLRDRIQRYVFLSERGRANRITASIGLATLPDVADTAEGLLQAADAAMYRVKVTGKNGIHVAGRDEGSRPPQEEQEPH